MGLVRDGFESTVAGSSKDGDKIEDFIGNKIPSTLAKRLARHFTFGRSRVLTPVRPDQVWVFFKVFPTPSHRVPTTFLSHPSSPYPSRIFPFVWLKRLWKVSAARPPSGGNEKCLPSLQTVCFYLDIKVNFYSNVFALKDVVLTIRPQTVEKSRHATLICSYDLEGASLYYVKWYRGTYEFYRYTPSEKPTTKLFPFKAINVDMNRSNSTQVVLTDIDFQLSGNFSCEVTTAEEPASTQTAVKSMLVSVFSHIDGKIRDGYGEDGCGRKVVRGLLTQNSPYLSSKDGDKIEDFIGNKIPSTVAKRLARHFAFGRSRVLTPVAPDQVYQPLSTAPIPTVPIPNLALESLSDSSGLKSGAYSGRLIFLCRIYEHSGASLINNSIKLPQYPPTISVGREPLDYGDVLRANCSSPPARPPAWLKFMLNNSTVSFTPRMLPRQVQEAHWSDLSLELKLEAYHFNRGKLILRCAAEVSEIYYEEAVLELASARNPVPEKVSALDSAGPAPCHTVLLGVLFFLIIRV
ncbi:hypothetical protein GEV33_014724 [Tenebrio molitor]|uniref:Ig-like domain-containing protein n=1 Tax=Tenebrio molitor TaxID=7067 RepID=A0A8J6H693_TENMO|nr:hypothetical protein GEV33_014724 [Tenebrio molitor]